MLLNLCAVSSVSSVHIKHSEYDSDGCQETHDGFFTDMTRLLYSLFIAITPAVSRDLIQASLAETDTVRFSYRLYTSGFRIAINLSIIGVSATLLKPNFRYSSWASFVPRNHKRSPSSSGWFTMVLISLFPSPLPRKASRIKTSPT